MVDGPRHEMELDRIHPSGAQEWLCPTCGRRFLMQWPPNYKKIVLEPGDTLATHSGGSVNMGMDAAEPMADEALLRGEALSGAHTPAVDPADEPDHNEPPPPWLKWLDNYDPAAD
jgi:hypothetical protein